MRDAADEQRLLDLAIAQGLVSAADVPATDKLPAGQVPEHLTLDPHELRWGARLAKLLAAGHVSVDDLDRLAATLAAQERAPPVAAGDAPTPASITLANQPGDRLLDERSFDEALPSFLNKSWDRYEFIRILGSGGMGIVYAAADRKLGRQVALKFLLGVGQIQTQRFLQEARAQARVRHPGICEVYEVGEVAGRAYIAMQLIDGQPLNLVHASMSLAEKILVVKEIAEALQTAHAQGIIHRDLKPANILIERIPSEPGAGGTVVRYRPIVMDFGLARDLSAEGGLTESGAVLGTPAYMSPEQARGETRRLDQRTDVYSLGATLYELVAGEPPFADASAMGLLTKVLNAAPVPPRSRNPAIPEELDTIICKCLNKEAHKRYATAKELAEDLERLLRAQRIVGRKLTRSYRLWYWARRNQALAGLGVGLLLSLLSLGGYWVSTRVAMLRRIEATRQQVELSRRLGQDLRDLEWIIRAGSMLPLHDLGYEQGLARERMQRLQHSLSAYGPEGQGLAEYMLGRGHLALHEYAEAKQNLQRAEALGVKEAELDLALGMTLGELFQQELEEVSKSGDPRIIEKRRHELAREYVQPALQYLQKGRKGELGSSAYIEGLIAWHEQDYDKALDKAHEAIKKTPWLYEARRLAGDVYLAQAHRARGQGRLQQMRQSFEQAQQEYRQAAEVGRSDAELYERMAEVWIRLMELDNVQGISPEPKLRQALEDCDKVLAVMPQRAQAYVKKSFAYMYMGHFLVAHNLELGEVGSKHQEAAESALKLAPNNVYALESLAGVYNSLVRDEGRDAQRRTEYTNKAIELLTRAIQINSNFPSGLNDLGMSYRLSGITAWMTGGDPVAAFQRSISYLEAARKLDPDYTRPLQSATFTYASWVRYQRGRGVDPTAIASLGLESSKRCVAANPNNFVCHLAAIRILSELASFQLESGQDASATLARAWQQLLDLESRFSGETVLHEVRSTLFARQGQLALLQGKDPMEALAQGIDASSACGKLNTRDFGCWYVQAQLRLLQAQAFMRKQQPAKALQAIAAGLPAAELSARGEPLEPDDYYLLCALYLQMVEAQLAAGQPVEVALGRGLAAAQQGLAYNPNYPYTLAVQGALLALSARREQRPQARQALAEQAAGVLTRSFALNPNLKRHYAAYF